MKSESISPSGKVLKLDRENARALHEQLSDRLRQELQSTYGPGDRIPTEDEICRSYGLSRVTVRRAIQTLVEGGLLLRRQGKGTFLNQSAPHFIYELDRFGPFMDALTAHGDQTVVHLMNYVWVADVQVPSCFGNDNRALLYDRLYETAGKCHAHLQISLPAHLGDRVTRADAAAMGVYQILQERLGVSPVQADFTLSTELPAPLLAQRMRVSPTTPLLVLERISRDANGHVIERSIHHLLPEVYKLRVSAQRELQKPDRPALALS